MDEIKLRILDRVKYIAEHFDSLDLVDMVTLFVACATMFDVHSEHEPFYSSYLKIVRQMVLAKQLGASLDEPVYRLIEKIEHQM